MKNILILIQISLKFSQGSNWQYSWNGSDNGLTPARRQAIIWTNDGLLCWRSASISQMSNKLQGH